MSTNISKLHREDLLCKIQQIRTYIASAQQDQNTGNLLQYLDELVKDVKGKKYGLVFEQHREAIDETLETHVPVLTEQPDLFIDNGGQMNFLIEGDNLASLQLLEKTHKGKIDVIYIDPPYNTGKKDDFTYDDNYVDINDTFRHSKYISFLSKRLKAAKSLLTKFGCIFISCDDNEQASIKYICDNIFGEKNFEGQIHWRRRHNQPNDKTKLIGLVAEHIICYSKNKEAHKKFGVGKVEITGKFSNPDNDPRGAWATKPWKAANNQSGCFYKIVSPTGKIFEEEWLGEESTFNQLKKEGRIVFPKNGNGSPRKKYYKSERLEEGQCATNWWPNDLFGCNQDATDELKELFSGESPFTNPKPTKLISSIIDLGSIKPNATILDFFAGSGTTGHAVMKLNAEDGGKRRFILCTNNENNICRDVTYERLKTVISGKRKDGSEYSEKYPASLKYYKVDFVPITDKVYYEYADELLQHVRELVELENGINFTGNSEIAIVLTDDEMAQFVETFHETSLQPPHTLYRGHNVLLTAEQEAFIAAHGIRVHVIPDYYYNEMTK